MKILQQAQRVEHCGDYIQIVTDSAPVRLYFLTSDILRIRVGFGGDFKEHSYTLTLTGWDDEADEFLKDYRTRVKPQQPKAIEEQQDCFIICGDKLTVRVYKDPFRLEILDAEGQVLHRDIPTLGYRLDSNSRRIHTSEINDGDHFYGFGEHTGTLNKAKCYVRETNSDTMGYDPIQADPLYKHIPFYIRLNKLTGIATGYFYHTTAECAFDMGRGHSNYWKKHSSYIGDDGDIDLFFIQGPAIKDVVSRYTDLTGKAALLPKSAIGYLGSSMYYSELPEKCDEAIIGFIDKCREEGIPIDGFQLSSGYCEIETKEGEKRCTFNWDYRRFADPKKFFAEMSRRGITVSPNVKPGQLLVNPLYQEMPEHEVFVREEQSDRPAIGTWWGGPGSFFDYTSPKAREFWKQKLKEQVIRQGTYSIWNDNCEFESIVNKDARVCNEGQGGTIGTLKSEMANLMCHITVDAIAEENKQVRPFVVCRAGHSGIQRYAQTWAGDNFTSWDSLKYNIATILGMGLSGVANEGCDIGGFYGPAPEAELFVRWVQNGIFQPRFSIHSTNTDNTVTEPWMYRSCADLIREAIRLRYRLSPHLYSLMARAHSQGLPIMAPVCLEFQDDPNCLDESVNFMEGDLFIANVVEQGAQKRTIYFPKGADFYDFSSYEKYEGGRSYEYDVDLATIPLFIRSGGIVPVAVQTPMNLAQDKVREILLKVIGDRDGSYTFYEDDGVSRDFEQGKYLKTRFTYTAGADARLEVTHEGSYQSDVEQYHVSLGGSVKSPLSVSCDGKPLTQYLRDVDYEQAAEGWHFNHDTKSCEFKFKNRPHDFTVDISYAKFDLLGM
ncbi:MAG: DUF4968 domain-containing protein [Succinivibrio sp.]|nr:DUF4968 domain-containing protein [Succinivibrio sp.]